MKYVKSSRFQRVVAVGGHGLAAGIAISSVAVSALFFYYVSILIGILGLVMGLGIAWMVWSGSKDMAEGHHELEDHELQVIAGWTKIQRGIEGYRRRMGQYPERADQATIGAYMDGWPVNPYTQRPMTEGGGAGDYLYALRMEGVEYKLHGNGKEGSPSRNFNSYT